MRDDPEVPLLGGAAFFQYKRSPRNRFFGLLYILCLGLTIAGGVVAIVLRNRAFITWLSHKNDPSFCPLLQEASASSVASATPSQQLLHSHSQPAPPPFEPPPFNPSLFMHSLLMWIGISVGGSFLVGVLFLHLVRAAPRAMVWGAITLQVAVPLGAGFAALLGDARAPAGGLFVAALLVAWVAFLWRDQLDLVGRLLGISAHGLAANPGLVLVVVLLQLALLCLVVPLVVLTGIAYTNGAVLPNPGRVYGSSLPGQCLDKHGAAIQCCLWHPAQWTASFFSLSALTVLWTVLLFSQIKVFTLAGAIAQWYFAPVGSPSGVKGTTLRSLRFALGPQFGSLCLSSLVLAACHYAHAALQRAQRGGCCSAGAGWLLRMLGCLVEALLSVVEGVTKFATVRMAITGEPFFRAGTNVVDLLKRNFMDTAGIWWLPSLVMSITTLVVALLWGVASGLASYFLAFAGQPSAGNSAVAVGVLSGVLALAILHFFGSVLIDITDAVYICFAMDRDGRACTRPEVHQVFVLLPSSFEHPGGAGGPDGHPPPYPANTLPNYPPPPQGFQTQQEYDYSPAYGVPTGYPSGAAPLPPAHQPPAYPQVYPPQAPPPGAPAEPSAPGKS